MTYYIDIIDTQDSSHALQLQHAQRNSLRLSWQGADQKDALSIVGSALDFTMEVLVRENVDAKFIDLFTGSEDRFRVSLNTDPKDGSASQIIWQGFLLPDSYSEPFDNGTFYPSFYATDGLGKLKGKYLPDTFYRAEHSVIAIFAASLQLTGLALPFSFIPAVENVKFHVYDAIKNWSSVYIDGLSFVSGDKRKSAYDIFQTLLSDMLCVCYQSDNQWFIEGLNNRHKRIYEAYDFDTTGAYIGKNSKTRLLKYLPALATPVVTLVPPYGEINVTHSRSKLELPDDIIQLKAPKWIDFSPATHYLYPKHWLFDKAMSARLKGPDYRLTFYNLHKKEHAFERLGLLNLLGVKRGVRYALRLKFKIRYHKKEIGVDQNVDDYKNILNYFITLNRSTLFTNALRDRTQGEHIIFNKAGEAALNFDFVASQTGLVDIAFYNGFRGLEGFTLDEPAVELSLTDLSFEAVFNQSNEVFKSYKNPNYTIVKDVELSYGDNASAVGNVFLLDKLREVDPSNFLEYTVKIETEYQVDGKYYGVVDVTGADLIDQHLDSVFELEGDPITDIERVIYNYLGTNDMVLVRTRPFKRLLTVLRRIKVRIPSNSGKFSARKNYERWRDSVFQIEEFDYTGAVLSVYKRLFSVPYVRVNGTFEGAVKFNDFLSFNYIRAADYFVTNCSWDIDNGTSEVVLSKAFYGADDLLSDTALLPVVFAGNDQSFKTVDSAPIKLSAKAFSANGFVVSYQWEVLQGSAVFQSSNTPTTLVRSPSFGENKYRISVTDNFGKTASDTLSVFIYQKVAFDFKILSLESVSKIVRVSDGRLATVFGPDRFKVKNKPDSGIELPTGVVLLLKIRLFYEIQYLNASRPYYKFDFVFKKNASTLFSIHKDTTNFPLESKELFFEVSLRNGDDLDFFIQGAVRNVENERTRKDGFWYELSLENVVPVEGSIDASIASTHYFVSRIYRLLANTADKLDKVEIK